MTSFSNNEVASILRKVASAYELHEGSNIKFKIAKYKEFAEKIERLPTQLIDMFKEGTLHDSKFLGKNILGYIIELFENGHVVHFDELLNNLPIVFFKLIELRGVGSKRALALIDELGLRTLDDLKVAIKENLIEEVPRFGRKFQEFIEESLREYEGNQNIPQRFLLRDILKIGQDILDYMNKDKSLKKIEAYICGSARRRLETVGDLDIAVSTKNSKKVLDKFMKYPKISKAVINGPSWITVVLLSGHQVDFRTQSPDSFGAMLIHFTGSKYHNIKLREIAISRGLSLSEAGVLNNNKLIKFKTEVELYNFFGFQWIPPELREGNLEFVLKIPELIKLTDLRGDLHIHSNYPMETAHDYGKHSMKEMIEKAQDLGYEYMCFSDHNPALGTHDKNQYYKIIYERTKYIEKLRSQYDIEIYNMLEMDILPSGELAIDEESLSLLDACLVSIHSSFLMSKEEMTERIIRGLSHPKAKIFAHPSARILLKRNEISADWDRIFDFCIKNDKALEINASYDRLDLNPELIKKYNPYINKKVEQVKLIISSDAHSLGEMDQMIFGIYDARRGWCSKEQIFNTRGVEEFSKWLKY